MAIDDANEIQQPDTLPPESAEALAPRDADSLAPAAATEATPSEAPTDAPTAEPTDTPEKPAAEAEAASSEKPIAAPEEPASASVPAPPSEPAVAVEPAPTTEAPTPAPAAVSEPIAVTTPVAAVSAATPEPAHTIESPTPAPAAAAMESGGPLLPPGLGEERMVPLRMTPLRLPRRPRLDVWGWLMAALALILLPGALAFSLWPPIGVTAPVNGPPDRIPAGANAWVGVTTRTPLSPENSAFGALSYPVDAQFASAYALRGGPSALGLAVTPAFECDLGVVQFFAAGALLHQTRFPPAGAIRAAGDLDPALARAGVRDGASGDVWLPLSQALLTAGSAASIGAPGDVATYVTLRDDTQALDLVEKPADAGPFQVNEALPQTVTLADGAFVVEGIRGGKLVGHAIPSAIWQFINQPQTAPDGWLTDVGAPLTEAVSTTSVGADGVIHHLLAQAFWQTIVVTDLDSPTQATTLEPVGLDYLRTLGAPTARVSSGAQRWTTQDGALRVAAGASGVSVSLGANAPVTLTGATKWQDGALWYAAHWSSPSRSGETWVAASTLTATRPTGMLHAGFDALSPSLASYLAGKGGYVGVVAYDITRNTTYTYNSTGLFTMASSAKVPLMISYLTHIESLRRGPNSYELSVLTAMIEHSDNNAAQAIYDTLGDQSGQQHYLRMWGIYDYTPNVNGWGWAAWSPGDMAHLLTLLYQGKVLNSADRALAFHLMRSIESDQRFGVGDTAPSGANVAMKDGWVPEPDGWWAVNTSGIVIVGSETYIVTVYTRDQASFGAGQVVVNHVAGAIGQALT
ncbi:MAG: serine hydrolase [Chloroflexota bacterium]|nr:serine hydrolase [Chloroflexota bacterium]